LSRDWFLPHKERYPEGHPGVSAPHGPRSTRERRPATRAWRRAYRGPGRLRFADVHAHPPARDRALSAKDKSPTRTWDRGGRGVAMGQRRKEERGRDPPCTCTSEQRGVRFGARGSLQLRLSWGPEAGSSSGAQRLGSPAKAGVEVRHAARRGLAAKEGFRARPPKRPLARIPRRASDRAPRAGEPWHF